MYKDKEKQRQAVKEATRRYRAKGITKVSRKQGITVISKPMAMGITEPHEPLDLVRPKVSRPAIDVYAHILAGIVEPPPLKSDVRPAAPWGGQRQLGDLHEFPPLPLDGHEQQSHNPMMAGYVPPGRTEIV